MTPIGNHPVHYPLGATIIYTKYFCQNTYMSPCQRILIQGSIVHSKCIFSHNKAPCLPLLLRSHTLPESYRLNLSENPHNDILPAVDKVANIYHHSSSMTSIAHIGQHFRRKSVKKSSPRMNLMENQKNCE